MQFKLSKIAAALLPVTTLAFGSSVYAAEAPTAEAAPMPTDDVEVIQVSGIAGSMAESARQKRFSSQIVDAVVAEDIGKLPDNNIAEALQRITGVSISSDFGVGQDVQIRGISDNRVELNGRSTAGEGRGGISLEDFPSSFLKTVEVVKSPTPEMIEGALGGTVSMKTVRPLELEETLAAFTFDAEYADKTENYAPKFTAAVGSNWDLGSSGTFGASIVLSYLDRELRQDEFITKQELLDVDLDGDGVADEGNTPQGKMLVQSENTVNQKTEQRERKAYGLSLQWAPASGDGNIYLDLNGTKLTGSQQSYSILDVGGDVTTTADSYQDANGVLHNYTLEGVKLIPKTISDFSENETYSHALGSEWSLSDQVRVWGEVAISHSETDRHDTEFTLRPVNRDVWNENGGYTSDADHTTDAYISGGSGKLPSIVYEDSQVLHNPDNLALRTYVHDRDRIENDEIAARFDVEYVEPFAGIDWLASVKSGVRITDREYEFTRSDIEFKDMYKSAYYVDENGDPTGEDFSMWIDEYNEMSPGSFVTITPDNSFDQLGKSGQNDLLSYTVYNGKKLGNPEAAFADVQSALTGTNYATTGSLNSNLEVDEGEYKKIEEKTQAVYMQFNLDFDDLSAVIGGRYVETELDSTIIENGEYLTGTNDYSDFLPSLNATYSVSDDTLVRFASAKVMRRADFDSLSPASSVNTDVTHATQGSHTLEPYRVTQYDLSVEHYFGTGGLMSAALFYKDVESFTITDNDCIADTAKTVSEQNVTQWSSVCLLDEAGVSQSNIVNADPGMGDTAGYNYVEGLRLDGKTGINTEKEINGGSGWIKGLELAYQQTFDFLPGRWSGIGVSTNYTYADSEQPDGTPMEDISKHTVNAQVYWEYDAYQVRLAYNWRDEFLDSENEKRISRIGKDGYGIDNNDSPEAAGYDPTAGNSYREARGQFDVSASWDINDHVTFISNVTNLTGEPLVYKTELGNDWKYREADRRITMGLRAKF
ncbi:TonB-dependent receptor [Neiella marina]|uniref:TonB-dependent receptor n=1 Tax=Neiella holothuriorum TaxID=2870530 RepID=A0ABS7EFS3_9GAMM|nr:TonB-dependent receptor [Neiella holothuriorum]MBW8191069.1 TonB-dependent receptor [Neiella holothuriorum]